MFKTFLNTPEQLPLIPRTSGLYYFYEGTKLLYIGRANNLRARIYQHRTESKRTNWTYGYPLNSDIGFRFVDRILIEEMDRISSYSKEMEMIYKLKPILNRETLTTHEGVIQIFNEYNDKVMAQLAKWYEKEFSKNKVL